MRAELGLGPDSTSRSSTLAILVRSRVPKAYSTWPGCSRPRRTFASFCAVQAPAAPASRLVSPVIPTSRSLDPQPDERFVALLHRRRHPRATATQRASSHFVLPSKLPGDDGQWAPDRGPRPTSDCTIRETVKDCATGACQAGSCPGHGRGHPLAPAGAPAEWERLGAIARARVQDFRREDVLARAFRDLMPVALDGSPGVRGAGCGSAVTSPSRRLAPPKSRARNGNAQLSTRACRDREQSFRLIRWRDLVGSRLSRRLAGSFGVAVLSRLAFMVMAIVLARSLGPAEYGLFTFAIGGAVVASPFAALGWPSLAVRRLPAYVGEEELGTACAVFSAPPTCPCLPVRWWLRR